MNDSSFIDYYKLLQVHYDASPEVIRAAYLKLSKTYHPDSSAAASNQMALLNEAFAVLSDVRKRTSYHREWLHYVTGESLLKDTYRSKGVVPAEPTGEAAKDALSLFFRYLCVHEWESAYMLLTDEDRSKTAVEDFINWRDAIAQCSEITAYDINFVRSFKDCKLEGILFKQVVEFNVKISELDLMSSVTSTNTVRKCCAYDGVSWRVWMGSNSIKSATLRFRMQAEKNKNVDPMALYKSAVNRIDPLTGLLSESGFFDECEKEIARTKRYNNPLTFVAFQLRCPNKDRETAALCQLASVIREKKRQTDIIARLNNDYIVCMLPETRKYGGELAAKKFLKAINERSAGAYTASYGLITYNPGTEIKTTITNACALAADKK